MDIKAEAVAKTYADGTEALKGVDFSIPSGEGVVILGPNGCGKSTLLRCMLGLEKLSSGRITVGATDIGAARRGELAALRRSLGSVFQHFNLVGNLTVFQNVLFGRLGRDGLLKSLSATTPSVTRKRALDCLDRVGLADLARRRTDTLSGGQQQRVAIARMLMQDARIVFADEPVASLDPKAGREVMDLLWEVVRERDLTVVCVLHQVDLALEYAGRVIGMKAGRVAFDAAPAALTRPAIEDLYRREPSAPEQPETVDAALVPRRLAASQI